MDPERIHLLPTQYAISNRSYKKKIIIPAIESLKTELIRTDNTLDLNQKAKFLSACWRINWIHITYFDQIIFPPIFSNSPLYPQTSFLHSTFQLLEEKSNHQSEQAANYICTNYSNDSPDWLDLYLQIYHGQRINAHGYHFFPSLQPHPGTSLLYISPNTKFLGKKLWLTYF